MPTRAFALVRHEVPEATNMVEGTLLVSNYYAKILFDPGSSHSFVTPHFIHKLHTCMEHMHICLEVSTPMGTSHIIDIIYNACEVKIDEINFPADLILLPISEYDVILGMNWLSAHHAQMDSLPMKARKAITKGAQGYLAFVINKPKVETQINQVPIVSEYMGVFPQELTIVPPDREVEFTIEVLPGTAPIARMPYRMATLELQELKTQLQKLMDVGFIRPSTSPWGAPYCL
ncbi:hypothetical protein DH2020_014577 [Rehmannia glutinosa]|uniref:Uncharacterized protein n=1 Tax=Rehmannia glutinosa TaxID=99300 RepID=A0ABR0WWW7_REHGL